MDRWIDGEGGRRPKEDRRLRVRVRGLGHLFKMLLLATCYTRLPHLTVLRTVRRLVVKVRRLAVKVWRSAAEVRRLACISRSAVRAPPSKR